MRVKLFFKKNLLLIILLIFFGWLFGSLLFSHMLQVKSDGLYSGGSAWGDLPFHLSFVNGFIERGMGTFQEFPVYLGGNFRYPFVMDFFSAILVRVGVGLRASLIWPSLILLIGIIAGIYFLTLKITKSKLGAFLAPFLFFINGSLYAIRYFWEDFKVSGLSLWNFLSSGMSKQYAHLVNYKIEFSNIICDYILPQRAIILGIIFSLVAIYLLWVYWNDKNKKALLWSGVIVGLMPIIHTHLFMALVFVAIILGLIELIKSEWDFKGVLLRWLYFVAPAVLISLPMVLWFFPREGGFLKLIFGWTKGNDNILWFWIKNLFLYIPFIIAGFIVSSKKLKEFYLPFLGLFVLSNIFSFQPYVFDNMKIMLLWFLMSMILVVEFFRYLIIKLKHQSFLIIIPAFILLILVGGLSVWRESYVSWRLFSNEDVALADFAKANTPNDSIFLTSDKHNHPISSLAGRKVLMGYRGWLWSQGIDYTSRESEVLSIYSGSVGAKELLNKYGVNYALIEVDKVDDFGINSQFFFDNYQVIYQSSNYILFKIF